MVNQNTGFNINKIAAARYGVDSRESTLNLDRTHTRHVLGTGDAERNLVNEVKGQDFGDMLVSQIDNVGKLENKAEALTKQFLIDPSSVNEHDITTASTEATLALNITTNIVSRALEAYRSIISLQ